MEDDINYGSYTIEPFLAQEKPIKLLRKCEGDFGNDLAPMMDTRGKMEKGPTV